MEEHSHGGGGCRSSEGTRGVQSLRRQGKGSGPGEVKGRRGSLSVGEEAGEALSEAADALGTHFILTKAAPRHRCLCKGEGIGQRLGFAKEQ